MHERERSRSVGEAARGESEVRHVAVVRTGKVLCALLRPSDRDLRADGVGRGCVDDLR